MGPRAGGMIRTSSKLNATYTNNHVVNDGKLALVSKSATMCSAVLDWAEQHRIGFSGVISYGTELEIDIADVLDFLAEDYRTRGIILAHGRGGAVAPFHECRAGCGESQTGRRHEISARCR